MATPPIQLHTSGAYLDLYPLLFTPPRWYTGARLSSGRYGSDKVLGDPTSFAERGTGRKDEIGESKSGMDDGRTRRDERGSSVVIARVMLPVSLLLLPLLSSRLCRCRCCCYCC